MGPPWGLQHMFPPHPVPGWRWTSCSFGYWAVICGWSDRSSWARWTCGTAGTRRHPLPPGRAQRAGQTARAGCESQVELPASVTQRATTTRRQPQTTTGSTDASPVHGPQPCYSPHVPENPARCARSSCAPGAVSPRKNSVQATGTFPDARKNSPRCPLPSARDTQGGGRSDSVTDVAAAGPSSPLSRDMAKCPQVGETQGRVMGWGAPTSQDTPTTASAAQGYASRQGFALHVLYVLHHHHPSPGLLDPQATQALPYTAPTHSGSHLAGSQQPHQLLGDSVPVLLHKPTALVLHLVGDEASAGISLLLPHLVWCRALLGHSFWEKSLQEPELVVATLPSSCPAAGNHRSQSFHIFTPS